jgi:flavin-dependent dehydrogenase
MSNCDALLIDQRTNIGSPDHCAGLLSLSGLAKIGLSSLPQHVIQNSSIRGAIFHSPTGQSFQVSRKKPQAVVVNRTLFDKYLFQRLEKTQVRTELGQRITKVLYDKDCKNVRLEGIDCKKGKSISYSSKIAILAEGRQNHLASQVGFPKHPKKNRYPAIQYLLSGVEELDPSLVELVISNKIAPGFFAWIIPISDSMAKVGLAAKNGYVRTRMDFLLHKNTFTQERFKKAKIEQRFGGEVIINSIMKKTSLDGLLVVGDAAGQTKATTGGGVITGGIAARIAGRVAREAVVKGKTDRSFLKKYDRQWQKILYNQLRIMALFRILVDRLSDTALDKVFSSIISNNLQEIMEKKGDIDSQAAVILALLRHPKVIRLGFSLLPQLISNKG